MLIYSLITFGTFLNHCSIQFLGKVLAPLVRTSRPRLENMVHRNTQNFQQTGSRNGTISRSKTGFNKYVTPCAPQTSKKTAAAARRGALLSPAPRQQVSDRPAAVRFAT
jgi:hypothetical protein